MVLAVATLAASIVSVEIALSVSIIEIVLGVILGNALGLSLANLGLLAALLAVKLATKAAAVYPLARRYAKPHAGFTTLLMSTGLTFGTISATYGYTAGIITKAQFSVLISVVVLSAIVPTAIAQRFFSPDVDQELAAPAETTGAARANRTTT